MVDPLSATLAVISLATALKDLIEVANNLYDLLKKPSHLLQDAQALAVETLEIAQDLEKFHQLHKNTLDDITDVRDAILRLLRDMKLVYNSCLPLFENFKTPSETKFRKMMSRLELWKNRKALEKRIGSLRDQAKKCYRQFMMRTQLGTAVAVAELKNRPTHQVSDEKALEFIGSAPTVLSKLPPDVILSEHLVYQLNIRIQVGKVDSILKALSSQSYPVEEPNLFHLSTMKTIVGIPPFTPKVIDYMQSDILMIIIVLQRYLNKGVAAISVQKGARTLNILAVAISQLGMQQEAVTLGRWVVILYGTLYRSNREVYALRLALQLHNLSINLMDTNDPVQANKTMEECLAILKTCVPTSDTQLFLANAVSHAAYMRARLNGDAEEVLKDMQESVAVFERLFRDQQRQHMITNPNQPRQPFTIFMKSNDSTVYWYAQALERLYSGLCAVGRHEEALQPGQKALELFSLLARRYDSLELYVSIAVLGWSLCHDRYRPQLSLTQALLYIRESGQKLELVSIRQAGLGSMNYIISLRKEVEILTELGRSEEAYAIFQKIVRVGPSMANNQSTYLSSLQSLTLRFNRAGYYHQAVMSSKTVVELCRPSTKSHQSLFIKAIVDHVSICYDFNRLAEGISCTHELLDTLDLLSIKQNSEIRHIYLQVLLWAGILHTEHGQPEWTISQCDAAIKILSPPIDDNLALWLVRLNMRKAVSLIRLDHISSACEAIKQGQDLISKYNLQAKGIVYSTLLGFWSVIHRTRGETADALEKQKVAISLEMANDGYTPNWQALSKLELDAGNDIEALKAAKKAVETTKHLSTKVVNLEHSYRQAQRSLFLCLLVAGDLPQAKQLITEIRGFYEWHAHSHYAWFIDLALALLSEIVLARASDQRIEESIASSKLSDLQHRLRTTLPSVGKQVDIALAREQGYPAWKRLLAKYPMIQSLETDVERTRESYPLIQG